MSIINGIKEQLVHKLNEILDNRINESKNALEAARESRDSETKSSMGDKYETGREMVQMEMGKYEDQMVKAINLKKALAQVNTRKQHSKVDFGSLVATSNGNYFISVGLGLVEFDGEKYFSISLASPIGNLLEGEVVGAKPKFQGREIEILEIS